MKNLLNSVLISKPKTNTFDLTHDVKLSCNMGELVPVQVIDSVPGDSFSCSNEALVRLAPLVAPMMHRCNITFHTFFVPKRLLWLHWEDFVVNNLSGGFPYAHPYMNMAAAQYGRLADFMGIDSPKGATSIRINPMVFSAYQFIWNEYYRDQNLQTAVAYKLADGDNTALYNTDLSLMQNRCWEHDYFTACLPFAQKNAAVQVPMGDVVVKLAAETTNPAKLLIANPDGTPVSNTLNETATGQLHDTGGNLLKLDPNGTLKVNAGTINDLRKAYRLQEFLEKLMRGGSRYTEYLRNIFGVKSPDARLQRPQYITGSLSPIVISEVLNTTGAVGAPPQGNMAGHGVGVNKGNYGKYFCTEHGYVMTIMSVMPKTAYINQTPKHFFKTTDFTEHFVPQFANIGEQEVRRKELYFDNTTGQAEDVFGYVPRYTEYKYENNRVAGKFRTTDKHWHMSREFSSSPLLNASFIKSDPTFRVFAVTDPAQDHIYVHVLNKTIAHRRMPKYGTPTF